MCFGHTASGRTRICPRAAGSRRGTPGKPLPASDGERGLGQPQVGVALLPQALQVSKVSAAGGDTGSGCSAIRPEAREAQRRGERRQEEERSSAFTRT